MRVISGSGPAPLVGREEELAVLRAALAAAASDGAARAGARRRRRRGIGKTRLVGALRETVGARPRRALVLGAQVRLDLATRAMPYLSGAADLPARHPGARRRRPRGRRLHSHGHRS